MAFEDQLDFCGHFEDTIRVLFVHWRGVPRRVDIGNVQLAASILESPTGCTRRCETDIETSMQQHAEQLSGDSGYNPIGDATDWLGKNP